MERETTVIFTGDGYGHGDGHGHGVKITCDFRKHVFDARIKGALHDQRRCTTEDPNRADGART